MTIEPNSAASPPIAAATLAPAILVLERVPRLETALKKSLGDSHRLVRPCRSSGDLIALAERMPESVCVLDWSGWPMELLGLLARLQLAPCRAQPVVVAASELAPLEWAAREAGATGFFAQPLSEHELLSLCERLLGHQVVTNVDGTAPPREK